TATCCCLSSYEADLLRSLQENKKLNVSSIEQFLVGCRPWRQTSFKLGRSEHLRLVQISKSDVRAYEDLLGQGGAA
ncbi:MAG: hypothetical protein JXN61_00970, partial [Sedimentisphaerales bacterium]|nr:hypothetical protein [Sedimentisphaerales bacterium]